MEHRSAVKELHCI